MNDYNVRIRFIGRMEGMPEGLQRQMREAEALMKDNTGIRFNVAANYGGQDEPHPRCPVARAPGSRGQDRARGHRCRGHRARASTRQATRLSTSSSARAVTSASNFLLWQSAYAEFYFTDVNWPDFTPACFVDAMVDFAGRDRRFGGLTNK